MKNKKTVLWIALLVMAIIPAYSQQYNAESEFEVQREGNGVEITKYIGKKSVVSIPPSIQNRPVTSIGDGAFFDCTSLTAITIPNSVTSIGREAFGECTHLTSVTFLGKITSSNFNDEAFSYDGMIPSNLGDIREKYLAGGPGTYTRARTGNGGTWTKQK